MLKLAKKGEGRGGLRAALLADTAAWKIPKKWLVLPALPVTLRGKTDARALQARLFGGADQPPRLKSP